MAQAWPPQGVQGQAAPARSTPLFWKVAVPEVAELREWNTPGLAPVPSFHVTLLYIGGKHETEVAVMNDMSLEEYRVTTSALQELRGSEVTLRVPSLLKHPEMIVAQVELPDEVPCASTPYLTICRSPGVQPKLAKELVCFPQQCEVVKLPQALVFQGVVELEESFTDRPPPARFAETTSYEGQLLKVETNPRPSTQTEPSGSATFLSGSEAEIERLAAQLAASVKARPLGPASCKLKARVQAPGKPGHLYIKWGAAAGGLAVKDIVELLEERLQELV